MLDCFSEDCQFWSILINLRKLIISVANKLKKSWSHLYNSILAKIYYLSILNVPISRNWKKSEWKSKNPSVCLRVARAHTLRTYVASAVVARQWFRRRARRTCVRCRSAARRLVALRRDFSLPSAIHEQLHRVARSTLRHTKYSKSKQGF